VVTSNPLPFCKYFDILFIGDSEQSLSSFFNLYKKYHNGEINLKKLLVLASCEEGIFVPVVNNKPKRAVLKDLNNSPTPVFQLISKRSKNNSIFTENFFIEVNRGCPYQCKFCISSFHNFPFRNRNYNNIINSIQESSKYFDYKTISLIGSCVSSHPEFKQICKYIIDIGKRLTIPSIRIEHLSSDIIEIFEKAGIKTITIAPESGSEELRYKIGKRISNENIMTVLTKIRDSQIKNVKFYFLIGLPEEREEHIDDIVDLLKAVDKLGFSKNSLRVNINPLIPKLNTPYEKEISFYLSEKFHDLLRKYQKLERELRTVASIKLKFKNFKNIIKNARLQTMISLGDHQMSDILLKYYYYGATFTALKKAEKEENFDLDTFLIKIKEGKSSWII
jgi:radical SAM superfamily enzyme YgiQ (UPF0313 family)